MALRSFGQTINSLGTLPVYSTAVKSHVPSYSPGLTKATTNPGTAAFSDLSTLISIRYAHQSEEEANSVCIPRARTGSLDSQGNEGDPHHDSEEDVHPHRPPANASHDSQRRHLAKEINEIIRASSAVSTGESTGLNRRSRYTMDKLAAGSTLPASGIVTATGNTANAQLAARHSAKEVSAVCSYNHDTN